MRGFSHARPYPERMTRLSITLPDDAPGAGPAVLTLEAWPPTGQVQRIALRDGETNDVDVAELPRGRFYFATLYRGDHPVSVRRICLTGDSARWSELLDFDPANPNSPTRRPFPNYTTGR